MNQELLASVILHADEVPCQALHEEGKTATSKSYMWIYLSGTDGKPPIILYDYRPGWSGDYPIKFLHGFTGMLQCDGYTFVLISPITITNPVVTQVSKDLSLIAHQRLCHTFYPDVLL